MPRFMRIAEGHDTVALTLAVTGLEGAGFTVLTPGRHMDSILPNTAGALGPVPILVPETQAAEAMAFLRAIPADGIRVLAQPRYLPGQDMPAAAPGRGWTGRFWQRLFALAGGRAGPADDRGPNGKRNP